jgi:Na+-translocating ferredoxin:NAD+ oxidoreductase RnfD subunit
MASNPYIHSKMTISSIMIYVIIALLPTTIFGIYTFGLDALIVVLVTVTTSVLSEYLFQKITKKQVAIADFNAVLTGLILAVNLPVETPWWMCVIGALFAVLIVKPMKCLNPALSAKCFLMILFAKEFVTKSNPIQLLNEGESIDLYREMIGNAEGSIGTTSMIAIMIGATFLVLIEVIDVRTPVAYIVTFVLFLICFSPYGLDVNFIVTHLCAESLMIGAWFMATDYMSSPITKTGKILYGILLGIFTGILRVFLGFADGVLFAILLGNLVVPVLNMITKRIGRRRLA